MVKLLEHEKEIEEYLKTIERLKKQNRDNPLFTQEIERLEEKLVKLKRKVYQQLTAWQRVQICRHPERPHTKDFIANLCEQFVELSGDRLYREDRAVLGGIGQIEGMRCVIMGQEKGSDTESRILHNFGSPHPEGYRKALRLMKLAEKFRLPVVSLIDTQGAFPGLGAEERGQAWAIAANLKEMAALEVPIIVILIGEGFSGGALGMGLGDAIGMLEHACYSVISPEGCASILWKDAKKSQEAARALKLNAEDMLRFEVIDAILPEPLGGAHHDPESAYKAVRGFILDQWQSLKHLPPHILIEQRYLKFRKMGRFQIKQTEMQPIELEYQEHSL